MKKKTYEIQDGSCDDGIEGGGAGEVEESVEGAETDGEDGGADGEVAMDADVREEFGVGDTTLLVMSVMVPGGGGRGKGMFDAHPGKKPRPFARL